MLQLSLEPGAARERIHPIMRSSLTISLFSERPAQPQQPYTFVASVVLHGVVFGLVLFAFISAPTVKTPDIDRIDVRHLDLHTLEPEMQRAAKSAADALHPHTSIAKLRPGGKPATHPPSMRQIAKANPGPQTLIQPDLPKPVVLKKKIPLPTVVIWDAQKTPNKSLVAPVPAKPPVADVKPSILPPADAPNLADLSLAASKLAALDQPILATTTSPIVVRGPQPTPPAPLTTAKGAAQPSSTPILSLSNMQMVEGNVTLPPANETAALDSSGDLAPGVTETPELPGQGNPNSKAGGTGAGQDADKSSDPPDSNQTADNGSGQGTRPSATHISLAINGQFGAVVVGSSMEEQYPETAHLWGGRLGYTVYLHVGTAQSWILQYSLPLAATAAEGGDISHIEPPWPYNIVRPNIDPATVNADALMIHGFVNDQGRFEALGIAFPPQFPEAQFVLDSLAQWQFRPASQNGKNIRVEVVLIIPEDQQ